MGVLKAQAGVSDVESPKLVNRSGLHLKQQATLRTNNRKQWPNPQTNNQYGKQQSDIDEQCEQKSSFEGNSPTFEAISRMKKAEIPNTVDYVFDKSNTPTTSRISECDIPTIEPDSKISFPTNVLIWA